VCRFDDGAILQLYAKNNQKKSNRLRKQVTKDRQAYLENEDLPGPVKKLFGAAVCANGHFQAFLRRFIEYGPDKEADRPGFVYVYARLVDVSRKNRDHVILHKVGFTRGVAASRI